MVVTGMMSQAHIFTKRLALLLEADLIVNLRSSQADAQPGAGDLQRVSGHADNVGDLLSTFSPLDEIYYLLKPFWRKLYRPPTSTQRRASFVLSCLRSRHGLTPLHAPGRSVSAIS